MARVFLILLLVMAGMSVHAQNDIDTVMRMSSNPVKETIKYKARDSVAMDLNSRRAYLYGEGVIDYEAMNLQADHVEVDFDKQTLHVRWKSSPDANITNQLR